MGKHSQRLIIGLFRKQFLVLRQLCIDETMKMVVGWCKAKRAQQNSANICWARHYVPLPNLHLTTIF